MPTPSDDDFLNRPLLRQLAGDEAYAAGERLVGGGRVRQPQFGPDRVTARVADERVYRAKVWRARGELQWSCTCAAGVEKGFCAHCAAVGLSWVHGAERATTEATADHGSEQAARARERLQRHLHGLDHDRLVGLVLEATDYDDILRRRLLMETTGVAGRIRRGTIPDFAAYRQVLHEAIDAPDYVDYDAMPDYVHGVAEAVQPLAGLLRGGHAPAVIELVELALVQLDRASDMIDASDGSLNAVYDDLQRLHLEACQAARPDPASLAARLLHYELEGGLGVFNNAAQAYADVLGPVGLAAWRQRLFEEWSDLSPAAPAPAPVDYRRFQIQALMETLAAAEGDLKLLAAVKQRDLASPHDFLAVAEWHQAGGRLDEAIAWAERGMQAFPASAGSTGLDDFLREIYRQTNRSLEAASLAWRQFAESPSLDRFRQLKACAAQTEGGWTPWRERALELTRQRLAAQQALHRRRGWPNAPDHSLPVELLLSEDAVDEAWAEAKAGGCRPDLLLQLAHRLTASHPTEALRIYREQLEPTIAQGGARAYREAIDLLTRISALLDELGRAGEFARLRAEVRATHRQKRGFVKLLDASSR